MVERVEQVIGSNKFQNACHKVVFDLDSLIEQSQANDTVSLTNNDMEYIKVIRISFIIWATDYNTMYMNLSRLPNLQPYLTLPSNSNPVSKAEIFAKPFKSPQPNTTWS